MRIANPAGFVALKARGQVSCRSGGQRIVLELVLDDFGVGVARARRCLGALGWKKRGA